MKVETNHNTETAKNRSPVTDHRLPQKGELAATCFLVNGSADLRLDQTALPPFLVEAFKLAGTGRKSEAAALLTEVNLAQVESLMAQGLPHRLVANVVLGLIWQQLKQLERAQECLAAAVAQEPNAAVYNMLANVYHFDGRVTETLAMRAKVLEMDPDNAVIQGAYARDLMALGDFQGGLARMQALLESGMMTPTEHSNYLFYLHYAPGVTQDQLVQAHRQWAEIHTPVHLARTQWPHDRDRHRPLRLGFLSADFHEHSASYAVRAMLDHHDRERFEIYGYSNVASPDEITERMAAQMNVFRQIGSMDNAAVAEQILADRVDILVAMSGHTGGHRLGVLAYKPAPIQVDWGWVNTTGIEQIDYRFTDAWFDPPGQHHGGPETLVRLPGGMSVFKPPLKAPDIGRLPAEVNGHVTFGCANTHLKINSEIIGLWAQVLQGCPGSRMLIKCLAGKDRPTQERWLAEFEKYGIGQERVDIMGWQAFEHYLEFYHHIDIALDTYPFSGCITSLEALWMGVPVVSLIGSTWVSRMGVSLLANAGFESLAARSPEQFVAKARALAAQPAALAKIRQTMRERLLASALFDGQRLTRDLEDAYRDMWHRWCREAETHE